MEEGEVVIDQVPVVWVGAAILVASFLGNLAFGRKISDSINTATIEVNTPWARPRLLSGRFLVVLWFTSALLYGISLPTTEDTFVGDGVLSILALGFFLLMCVAAMSYRRSMAHQADSTLDERERSVRNELYLFSYRVLASTAALIWIALFAAFTGFKIGSGEDLQIDFVLWENSAALALILIAFVVVLPSLVHAWLHPVQDDELGSERKDQWEFAKRRIKEELQSELAELRDEIVKEGVSSPKAAKALKAAEAELKKAERYLSRDSRPKKAASKKRKRT
jgi:hypothetical protein